MSASGVKQQPQNKLRHLFHRSDFVCLYYILRKQLLILDDRLLQFREEDLGNQSGTCAVLAPVYGFFSNKGDLKWPLE